MLIRLVQAKLKPGALNKMEAVYRNEVIPALNETEGCLFGGLLQDINKADQAVSLTLWDSKEHIKNYVESGAYRKNLDKVAPYLEESSEWRIQLTKDDVLNYEPVKHEPDVESYPVITDVDSLPEEISSSRKYLRILSLEIMQGKAEEFKKIYHDIIIPELKKLNGCRYAFLIDNSEEEQEMLSFTIWDDLQSVELYEQEGKFRSLLEKVQDTLAELYQWKMSLENNEQAVSSVSSRDIDISKFTLVTGEKFE